MRWFLPERRGSHRHLHLIICLGLGMLGIFLLGLGLVRLWFTATIWTCILAGGLAAILLPPRIALLPSRIPAGGRVGWILLSLPALYIAIYALCPYLFHDSLTLYLALPQQAWFEHGLVSDRLILNSKFPILSEMLWVWAICIDEERIHKLATAIIGVFGYGSLILLCARFQNRKDWWITPMLLGMPVIWNLQFAKPDVIALALAAAGLVCADKFWAARAREKAEGRDAAPAAGMLSLAWLLMGFAMSVKYTAIFGVITLFFWGPIRYCLPLSCLAANLPRAALMLVPLLPWWGRDYLLYGNPFYIALYDVLPPLGYDPECAVAMQWDHGQHAPAGLDTTAGVIQTTWTQLVTHQFALGLIAPALFLPGIGRPVRRLIFIGLVLSIVNMGAFRHVRQGIIAGAVLAIGYSYAIANIKALLPAYFSKGLKIILALAGLAAFIPYFATYSRIQPLNYFLGKETKSEYWQKIAPSLSAIREEINLRQKPAALLLIGDQRSYGFASKVLIGSHYGHPPLVWQLVKSSQTTAELRKRLFQLNVECIGYNSISALYQAEVHSFYPWTDSMLARYRNFLESYTELSFAFATIDNVYGAYYCWRLLARPAPVRRPLFFMPGAEWIWLDSQRIFYRDRPGQLIAALKRHAPAIGRLGQMDSIMGHAYLWNKDWAEAYRLLKRSLSYGIIDDQNLFGLAIAALETGHFEESEKLFQKARLVYPERQGIIDEFMPAIPYRSGEQALSAGDFKRAEIEYRRCLDLLDRRTPSADRDLSKARALMRLGKIRALRGELKDATGFLEQACRTSPSAMETEEATQLSALLEKTR